MASIEELKKATQRKGSFRQTVSAVLWSFFGVRRGEAHDADMAQLNPVHVVIVGVGAGILFVTGLVFLVRSIVA